VDFDLSEDQVALRDAAAALLDGRCSMQRVREVSSTPSRMDRELWTAMADQGWLAVERPAEEGGLGLGMVEVVVLCEQLGAHLAPVPFVGSVLCAQALGSAAAASGAGTADADLGGAALSEWSRRLSAGDAVGAIAWSSNPSAVTASETSSGGWQLNGRADPVVYGPAADVVLIVAATGSGPAVFAVANGGPSPGAGRPEPEPAMDVTRSLAWMDFSDRPALFLGATDAAETLLDRAATALSAEMLGAAARVVDFTVDYAKDRVQFGRPIGSFQAVKHRCADMLVDTEGMRSSAYFAGGAVGAGDPEASSAASVAKVWCSDASARVMASALQVHGGIGFTWEHDMHLYLKRSQLDQVTFGGAVYHRERLARILRPRAEAGLPVL